jgi:feruloyl esterase
LVARNHYGRFPRWSYFSSCSNGGFQALTEAQRFPGDYDGVVAGNPANNRTRLILGFLWNWLATHRPDGTRLLSMQDLQLVTNAAMTGCDDADGLKDGAIGNPRACGFDPSVLQCTDIKTEGCLKQEQVDAVRTVYAGARDGRTGAQLFPGWTPGTEAGWEPNFSGIDEPQRVGFLRSAVFHDPNWDPRTFDWDQDLTFVETQVPFVNATSLQYDGFKKRGGKLIMYMGLADPVIPAEDVVSYYEHVARAGGGYTATGAFFRFFAVPGMAHCSRQDAPYSLDTQAAIEAWVEHGRAPEHLLATQRRSGQVVRTRLLCPYPQVATPVGGGPPEDASSFQCVTQPPVTGR